MSELIRKLKEKKYITKIKVKDDISDELISKEIPQVGSVKIVEDIKKGLKPPYAVMRETNAPLMDIMYRAKLAANEDYMTYEEAANVCSDDLNTGVGQSTSIFYKYGDVESFRSFDEFQYFTGVEEIKDYTFYNCSELTSITLPASITSISGFAFMDCSSLTSIEIPNSVTLIGEYAFYSCSGLTSIVIPDSVTSIGESAFDSCTNLASITIPNSVTSIGNYAFSSCDGLESIVVESGNVVYDSRDNCNAIIKTDTNTLINGCKNTIISDSVTSIGDSAFQNCSGLTSLTIPNSVTTIGNQAFRSCTDLTSIAIPNSVTSIGDSAFRNCRGLTGITIGTSVTSIGEMTFEWCISLSSITCLATTAPITCDSFGYSTDNYTGRNTYDQGINKLKVSTGATGYDTDEWLNPLQNPNRCGFTIEYI